MRLREPVRHLVRCPRKYVRQQNCHRTSPFCGLSQAKDSEDLVGEPSGAGRGHQVVVIKVDIEEALVADICFVIEPQALGNVAELPVNLIQSRVVWRRISVVVNWLGLAGNAIPGAHHSGYVGSA